ncbi:uncharacterized protein DUF1189 [Cytobacillus horneckiae]|uniref:DUF1189 domain-containing protein n=1 Tax=Cytobacillus horneckiae TaxID=549687 RepID=A0A2N0ZHD2_9BACI|nr:DUF1189 domain-containing protein [Cytobacillus horneckiae]MBN6888884.1 DUF1189 domain-containing protein [Cytobacillus horneckiae]MCM3179935.1 DUF1189 domain-containing protein [Cytobacillus horneckiae]MEC1155324.1 DUF1189 domain-containing protein [Cytobacillus horneckiae]MED2936623.1 DUF1189 domain-containing protein [Cytobacillus horneckiae]PKG28913.1 DUF1189 domain-containing protein [Cytobacillus horneckiae]
MNIFKQLIKSIYSPKDIASFRTQGIGKTIGYVFFLTLLSVIPSIYFLSASILNGVNSLETSIEKDFPNFVIENGKLQSDEEVPITINNKEVTIIFDSNGIVKKEEILNSENTIAFLEDEFIFVSGGQQQGYAYSMLGDVSLDKETTMNLLSEANSWLLVIISIMAILIYLFTVSIRFIEISILALLGLLIVRILQRGLEYRFIWRMAAYSVTLSTVFFTIMGALQTTVPNGALISWLIGIIMLMLSIKEIPHKKDEQIS